MKKLDYLKEIELHIDHEFHYAMDETHGYIFKNEKIQPRFKVVEAYVDVLVTLINERIEVNPKIVDEELSPLVFGALREASELNLQGTEKYAFIHNTIGEYCFSYALLRKAGLPSASLKNNPVEVMQVDGFCNPIKIKMENEENDHNSGFRY